MTKNLIQEDRSGCTMICSPRQMTSCVGNALLFSKKTWMHEVLKVLKEVLEKLLFIDALSAFFLFGRCTTERSLGRSRFRRRGPTSLARSFR